MPIRQPPVLLIGPTASGKTEMAVRLVQEFPLQIISVDSAMVYRGMDIGTAKPDHATLALAPHRLIDILDPSQPYSAAQFCEDAQAAMDEIYSQGAVPLFVGGTFLYFKALRQGLSQLPAADKAVRSRIEQWAQAEGWGEIHRYLSEIDPQSAARIHPNDPQRLQRALEVYEITGKSLSEHFESAAQAPMLARSVEIVLASPDRAKLHERIEKRFQQMLNHGLVAEVERLYRRPDLSSELPSIRSVGYRQVWDYLDGRYGYQEMISKAVAATRQFAKRQYTWLRSQHSSSWINPDSPGIYNEVLKKLASSPILDNS